MATGIHIQPVQFFRATVGVVLVDHKGLVLALERAMTARTEDDVIEIKGTDQWRMLQHGLALGDEPAAAAVRLLRESLGLSLDDFELMFEYPGWLAHELPPAMRSSRHGRGQAHKWYFYRLTTSERRIDLSGADGIPEFTRFRWMTLASLAEMTWEVRQPLYRTLALALAQNPDPA